MDPERNRLNKIAEEHSYAAGFNGKMAEYRWRKCRGYFNCLYSRTNALEIGAGEGQITKYLVNEFKELTVIEPAVPYFQKLVDIFPAGKSGGIVSTCFESYETGMKFDAIFCLGVLEHVQDPVLFLTKAKAMLAYRGCIFITVPNANSIHRFVGKELGFIKTHKELGEHDVKVGHRRYYDESDLISDLSRSNFTCLGASGIMWKPFPDIEMNKLPSEQIETFYRIGQDDSLCKLCAELFVFAW